MAGDARQEGIRARRVIGLVVARVRRRRLGRNGEPRKILEGYERILEFLTGDKETILKDY